MTVDGIPDPNEIRRISVADLRPARLSFRFLAANTPYAIPHNAGRLPTGYKMVSFVSTAAPADTPNLRHEYTDEIRWNRDVIVLRATVAGDYTFEVTYGPEGLSVRQTG